MNLDGMLKEGSLTDLTWLDEGMKNPGEVTFDPVENDVKNPNNVKPEAQEQWGYGDISTIFDDDNAGTVDRNIPEKDLGDAAPVVVFARNLMNQGATPSVVDRELKARYTKEDMRKGLRGLKELLAMDGIIGRIAVDARGYESCSQAMEATANSPYKNHIQFIIGCSCGDPQMIPVADEKQEIVAMSGNALDDFFADERVHQVKEIPHCRSTMIPLCASIDSIDPSWTEGLMTVVENISGLPADEAKRIRMLDEKPIKKVQMAFQAVDRIRAHTARRRYNDAVDASDHMMDTAENEIELFATAQAEIEIDPVNHAIQHEVVAEPMIEVRQAKVDMVAEMTEIELGGAAHGQLEGIELSEAGDISLFEARESQAALNVDPTAGDYLGEEMPDILSSLEPVDMTMEASGIFEDADVIELDTVKTALPELDVNMNSEIEW